MNKIYSLCWDNDILYFSSYEDALIGAANIIVDEIDEIDEFDEPDESDRKELKYQFSILLDFLKSREYEKALDLWNNICYSEDCIYLNEISQEKILPNPTHPTAEKLKELEEIVSSGLEK